MIWAFAAADKGFPSFPTPVLPHRFETMPHVDRVTRSPEVGELVDSIEKVESFARDHGPGRYQVEVFGGQIG
jgi:hypothetical protein